MTKQRHPVPKDEKKRLAALSALHLLDSPPEERFDRISRLASRLFGVPTALVSLVDAEQVFYKSRLGFETDRLPREESFCSHAIMDGEPLVVPDALKDERFQDNPMVRRPPGIRFYAGCPITARSGERVGAFCIVDQQPRDLSEEEIRILADLASMVEEQISALELATVDELTGLSNRRGLLALGKIVLDACRKTGREAALLVVDLDGFKGINDTLGHAAGDEALKEFSRLLLENFRESDVVARIGGDEFCVLVTGPGAARMEELAERSRGALERRNAEWGRPAALSCSFGIVRFDPERHADMDAFLKDADGLMYEDKRAGRERSR